MYNSTLKIKFIWIYNVLIMNMLLRLLAFIGILALSPLIIVASIFIFFEDGLPVFFNQKRIGKNEKIFTLLKIRTMHKDTPNLGTHEININSYLKIGKILRDFKIDELPQIINFIIGDLNLVGPRPGLPNQIKLLNFRRKHNVYDVKPGITGLGQILNFDMSNPEMLAKIDNLYIENKGNFLDFKIFIATFLKNFRSSIYEDFKHEIEIIQESNNV